MAELTQQERLQPSLLDRLTDDAPDKQQESREQRVLSLSRIRESVVRDLGWLLNTVKLEASVDLEAWPEVQKSVVNFGIPDLTGTTINENNTPKLQREVRNAIVAFEPRISPDSLDVRAVIHGEVMSNKALLFILQGEMWAKPTPQALYLRTEVDLETGRFLISERAR